MLVIAHIGKIPVEEYAGFVVPVIALYAYGRAWSRRHRMKLASLPPPSQGLDERTVQLVLARWAEDKHGELGPELVALMYPPGPDGATAAELAQRLGAERASVEKGSCRPCRARLPRVGSRRGRAAPGVDRRGHPPAEHHRGRPAERLRRRRRASAQRNELVAAQRPWAAATAAETRAALRTASSAGKISCKASETVAKSSENANIFVTCRFLSWS